MVARTPAWTRLVTGAVLEPTPLPPRQASPLGWALLPLAPGVPGPVRICEWSMKTVAPPSTTMPHALDPAAAFGDPKIEI